MIMETHTVVEFTESEKVALEMVMGIMKCIKEYEREITEVLDFDITKFQENLQAVMDLRYDKE